jgi:hypothetical protein
VDAGSLNSSARGHWATCLRHACIRVKLADLTVRNTDDGAT